MPDPIVDTPVVPADGAEPIEPTVPAEPAEPVDPIEPAEPSYITTEQMQDALSKQDSSFRSWLGRRDKDTMAHIGNVITERMNQRPAETNDEMSTRLLESPRDVIRSEFEAMQTEQTQKTTNHVNSTVETVGNIMESDPLYNDKDLGNEVVEQIKEMVQTGKIEKGMNPTQAGKLLLADALANVVRTRQASKVNPLGNNVAGGGAPNLSAPSKVTPKLKVPKLDTVTQEWAKKWGYSDEDLAQLYGE